MDPAPASPRIATQIRLPADLHSALVERTTTNDLSLNETMVRMLRFAIAAQGTKVSIKTTCTEEWTV